MNLESFAYANNSFDAVLIIFFYARLRSLGEAIRVLYANGRLKIVEYGELTNSH